VSGALGLFGASVLVSFACSGNLHPAPPLPVQPFPDEILVTAWAEPSRLPSGGGDSQILVRVRRKGGGLVPGVEVRFQSSTGTLYSQGKVLLTDARGMTRDRITTHQAAIVTVNAGGTPSTVRVSVGDSSPNP
jgi:hypothetical protein